MLKVAVVSLSFCSIVSGSVFGKLLTQLESSEAAKEPAWNSPIPSLQLGKLESISDILSARGGSEISSLVRAKQIIQDLSFSPSCVYGPTAHLLRQCKSVKPKTQDPSSDQLKSKIQATYGISMALCEARQARVSIPPACEIFENASQHQASEAYEPVFTQTEIENCMHLLFDTASWTSYIAFRAQSADLCDSSRTDYQREELLEFFREATNVIPEFLEALKEQNQETLSVMNSIRNVASEVTEAHQGVIASSHAQILWSKDFLHQISQYLESYIQEMNESGKSWQVTLKEGVEQATKDLAFMQDRANSIQINFAELYATAAEAVSSMTFNFETSVEAMTKQTHEFAERIIDLNVNEHVQQIRRSMHIGQTAASEFATVQSAQKKMIEEQLITSHALLEVIEGSHGQFRQIQQTLDMIPTSWLGTFHGAQNLVMRLRNEITYALIFATPSVLLLVFRRVRAATVLVLTYLFLRTFWSIHEHLSSYISEIPFDIEDLKVLGLCTLGSACAGGSAALVSKILCSLLLRLRSSSTFNDAESAAAILGKQRPGRIVTTLEAHPVLPHGASGHTNKEGDRFARASTV